MKPSTAIASLNHWKTSHLQVDKQPEIGSLSIDRQSSRAMRFTSFSINQFDDVPICFVLNRAADNNCQPLSSGISLEARKDRMQVCMLLKVLSLLSATRTLLLTRYYIALAPPVSSFVCVGWVDLLNATSFCGLETRYCFPHRKSSLPLNWRVLSRKELI